MGRTLWSLGLYDPDEDNAVEFFDSYAKCPDYWLSKNTHKKNQSLGQTHPFLLDQVMKEKRTWYYNDFAFQGDSRPEDILTCGRWCLLRIQMRDYSLDAFKKFVFDVKNKKKLKSLDATVAYLTKQRGVGNGSQCVQRCLKSKLGRGEERSSEFSQHSFLEIPCGTPRV